MTVRPIFYIESFPLSFRKLGQRPNISIVDGCSSHKINSGGMQMNAFIIGYNPDRAQSIPKSSVTTPAPENEMNLLRNGKQYSSAARAPYAEIE